MVIFVEFLGRFCTASQEPSTISKPVRGQQSVLKESNGCIGHRLAVLLSCAFRFKGYTWALFWLVGVKFWV